MEDWQTSCITKNLDKLIQTTECNVLLLANLVAANILSDSDKLTIEAENHPHKKAAKLYDFVKTRKKGFSCMAKAFREYKQTGALEILKSSFLQQDVKKVLSTTCNSDDMKYLFAKIPDFLLQKVVQLHKNEYIDNCLFQENHTEFIINTIPNCPAYYVPRSISNRLRLDTRIFKVQCPDVFVFKDIARHRLSKLVKPLGTESSSRQMDELTCKFIHLNDEADFLVICQNRNDKPVHLVKYEINRQCFILEESCGKSQVLRNFLDESRNQDRCFVSEDIFIHNIESNNNFLSKGYCICDSPGSGKTWLLASLARKLKSKYSDRVIVFQRLSEMDFSIINIDDIVDNLVSKFCQNLFFKTIIKAAIKDNGVEMEIFLDAFDEIDVKYMEAARKVLGSLKATSENVRLFVTSRPHLRHELESTLGVVSYDIRPFDKENQRDFLKQYWSSSIPCNISMQRLDHITNACQEKVQTSLSSQEKDIMGIPLQCYMLAEIYLKKARKFCNTTNTTVDQFFESPVSLFQMYKRFITLKLQKLNSELNEDGKRTKCYHTWKALEIISPELAVLYKQFMFQDDGFFDLEYLLSGVVQGVVNNNNHLQISFVHQTFAEFLVAELISDILIGNQSSYVSFCKMKSPLMKFVANEVFQLDKREYMYHSYSFQLNYLTIFDDSWPLPGGSFHTLRNTVIPLFLNEHLKFAFSSDSQNDVSECLLEFLRPNRLFQVLLNCVKFGWLYLIKLLTRQLQSQKKNPEEFLLYRSVLLGPQINWDRTISVESPVFVFCIAAKFANLSVLKECVQLYEECFDYNFIDAIKRIPVWMKTPYHEALERGDYSMVEYFMQFELSFGNRWLLHQCIYDSYFDNVCKVNTKIEILSLLLNDKEHLVWDSKHAYVHGPLYKSLLLTPKINLKIIKYLLSKMQESMQTNYSPVIAVLDFEAIKYASSCMNTREFHELCRVFFVDLEITRTANTKRQLIDILNLMLQRQQLELETLQIVLREFSSAELSDLSSALLYNATRGYQSTETFELLVKQGVSLFATDEQGHGIIHYAAKSGNKNIFKYLLTKGFSVNQQTLSGMTPLMVSAEKFPKMLLFILQNGANVSMKDQIGETFCHKFARKLESSKLELSPDAFHELVTFVLNQPEAMKILKSKSWKQIWTKIREPYYLCSNLREFCKKSTLLLLRDKLGLDLSYCEVGYDGNNVLLEAIENRMSFEFIEGLFECGASMNITNKRGQNALHLAAFRINCQIVTHILNKSSLPINGKDRQGNTPLHLTLGLHIVDWKAAKLFLERGADPHTFNQNKETFAHDAARLMSETEFCELITLLQKHANDPDILNRKNGDGETLLHARLKNTNESLDNFTLNQIRHNPTVDVNFADNSGNTLFLVLAHNGNNWNLVKILAETKACITSKNNEGYGVLHYAAEQGSLEMVKHFHSLGLSLDDETIKGDTPILLAYQHLPVIKYLYSEGCDICAVNKNGEGIIHKAATMRSGDTFLDLVLFLKQRKIIQPFIQVDLKYCRSTMHLLLFQSKNLPDYLVSWIVNLPEYDISSDCIYGDNIFQTAIERWHCLTTCGIDAIYNAYCISVEPEALKCALLKALAATVDKRNANAARFLLKRGANPNLRDVKRPTPIDTVIKDLSDDKNRKGYTFFQLSLILDEFLTFMLSDKSILGVTDNCGNTFLHDIAKYCHPDDFKFIVTQICKRDFTDIFEMKNKSGKTPITTAIENIQLTEETLRILCQNGIAVKDCSSKNPNRIQENGQTKCAIV